MVYGAKDWFKYGSTTGRRLGSSTREARREGVGPPMAPLTLILVGFTSRFTSILTNITSKFADNHGIDCM